VDRDPVELKLLFFAVIIFFVAIIHFTDKLVEWEFLPYLFKTGNI